MTMRLISISTFLLVLGVSAAGQNLPFDVLTVDHKYREVLYTMEVRGKFYYFNDETSADGRGGATFGTMEHTRTVTRLVDFSKGGINITETIKNDADVNWAEMKPAFLFPSVSKWKEVSDQYQGTFRAGFTVKPGTMDAKAVIKGLFGLTPRGKVKVSVEAKTYKTGIEVKQETRETQAVKLYFESEYQFTALDRKKPLKITARHWIWLSADIPGGFLERIDQVVFPENEAAPKDYYVQCRTTVERVGTHEELYAESQNAENQPRMESMLTEKLDHLESLRTGSKKDYDNYVDPLMWEIADALDEAKGTYPGLYAQLKKKYPAEIGYYEKNVAGKNAGKDSESLIDAYGLEGAEDY